MINTFNSETNEAVKNLLIELNQTRKRVRIWYGDTKTGVSWNEENDVMGSIGCSTGPNKIPLLIKNSRSDGGGSILDGNIIRIDDIKAKKTLYKHDNFQVNLIVHENTVRKQIKLGQSELFATFETEKKAWNFLAFMKGERYAKN